MHFKNGAPTQVLRKVRILTKFGLCYTMNGNVKKRKMQISLILYIYWQSNATFLMRRFLLTSVYNMLYILFFTLYKHIFKFKFNVYIPDDVLIVLNYDVVSQISKPKTFIMFACLRLF